MASVLKVGELQDLNGNALSFGTKVKLHRTLVLTESSQALSSSWSTINGMFVTLSPESASSVFRIDVRWFGEDNGSNWDTTMGITRNGTAINLPGSPSGNAGLAMSTVTYHLADDNNSTPEIANYFTYDEPATTSEITYAAVARNNNNSTIYNNRTIGSTASWNYERGSCEILVTEYVL